LEHLLHLTYKELKMNIYRFIVGSVVVFANIFSNVNTVHGFQNSNVSGEPIPIVGPAEPAVPVGAPFYQNAMLEQQTRLSRINGAPFYKIALIDQFTNLTISVRTPFYQNGMLNPAANSIPSTTKWDSYVDQLVDARKSRGY
jgi:hypothetical protein